ADPSGLLPCPGTLVMNGASVSAATADRANNDELARAEALYEDNLAATIAAAREADWLNHAVQSGQMDGETAEWIASGNENLAAEEQQSSQQREVNVAAETEARYNDVIKIISNHLTQSLYNTIRDNNQSDQSTSLLVCWAAMESSLNPSAIGQTKAEPERGLFQLKPSTANGLGAGHFSIEQLYKPAVNTRLASIYLKQLTSQFGNLRTALGAFKEGPTNMKNDGFYPHTTVYVDAILRCSQLIFIPKSYIAKIKTALDNECSG